MVHEVRIKLSQRYRRTFGIPGCNHSAPQQIVYDHDAASPQILQTKIEVLRVFFLHCIDEQQIESLIEIRHHFQSLAALDLDTIQHTRALQVTRRSANHLVARLDCYDDAVLTHAAREMGHRVTDRHSDLQRLASTRNARGDLHEPRYFTI